MALSAAMLIGSARGQADEHDGMPNIEMPTLGGKQLWGDTFIYAGWRIQENLITGHSRLLDPDDVRHAWGTDEQCLTAFRGIRDEKEIAPSSSHMVLMLHGLFRSKDSFGDMPERLADAGYEPSGLNYPSMQESVQASADRLNLLLNRLDGVERVSFVTHSLGSIVLRVALAERSEWQERISVNRVVLIAPPSKGSAVANLLVDFPPYQWLTGDAGQELTYEAAADLPGLDVPFGIVAGGRGDAEGYNPMIEGDDDGTVAVAETRLEGALDTVLVDRLHSFVHTDDQTIEAVLTFLENGCFSCP